MGKKQMQESDSCRKEFNTSRRRQRITIARFALGPRRLINEYKLIYYLRANCFFPKELVTTD
jgi:hypothetical protein